MTEHSNGHFKEDVAKIRSDVSEMKDDLSRSIEKLNAHLMLLTSAIDGLTGKWESLSETLLNSIPIKAVMWMFVILGVTIVLVIAGVEGIRALTPALPGLLK